MFRLNAHGARSFDPFQMRNPERSGCGISHLDAHDRSPANGNRHEGAVEIAETGDRRRFAIRG
jgi:hypothetical protein